MRNKNDMQYILRRRFCCVVRYHVAFCYQIMKRRIAHFLTNTCVYCLNFKSRNKNTGENNSYKNTFSLIKSCSREIYFGLLEWNKKCTINNGLCKTLKLTINCKLYYTFYIFTFIGHRFRRIFHIIGFPFYTLKMFNLDLYL